MVTLVTTTYHHLQGERTVTARVVATPQLEEV